MFKLYAKLICMQNNFNPQLFIKHYKKFYTFLTTLLLFNIIFSILYKNKNIFGEAFKSLHLDILIRYSKCYILHFHY